MTILNLPTLKSILFIIICDGVLGLTPSSMKKASEMAGLHPYRKKIRQKLLHLDLPKRLAFANWMLNLPPQFENTLIISDESVFDLNGFSNAKNEIEWFPWGGGGNPHFAKELTIQPGRLMIWAAVLGTYKIKN